MKNGPPPPASCNRQTKKKSAPQITARELNPSVSVSCIQCRRITPPLHISNVNYMQRGSTHSQRETLDKQKKKKSLNHLKKIYKCLLLLIGMLVISNGGSYKKSEAVYKREKRTKNNCLIYHRSHVHGKNKLIIHSSS